MEETLSQNVMEQIQQALKLRVGRTLAGEELDEARFNLTGFARTLLKMKMEQKYGSVAN